MGGWGQWNSDDEVGGHVNLELPSPKDLAYKPKPLSRGGGGMPTGGAGGGKRNRWTEEEVERLKAGVKRYLPVRRGRGFRQRANREEVFQNSLTGFGSQAR